ncbi:hypothetical protein B0H17DRAFT_1144512 [Mycena rosella]|uniref:Uncharacterized protein n=1 Tax=Mycena rosella TaxID=1033263 RepID=A0AAD7CT05_MYCRO|nr:hypothetical protein B0H17DRAFT_1144512 [Mycena rosella]
MTEARTVPPFSLMTDSENGGSQTGPVTPQFRLYSKVSPFSLSILTPPQFNKFDELRPHTPSPEVNSDSINAIPLDDEQELSEKLHQSVLSAAHDVGVMTTAGSGINLTTQRGSLEHEIAGSNRKLHPKWVCHRSEVAENISSILCNYPMSSRWFNHLNCDDGYPDSARLGGGARQTVSGRVLSPHLISHNEIPSWIHMDYSFEFQCLKKDADQVLARHENYISVEIPLSNIIRLLTKTELIRLSKLHNVWVPIRLPVAKCRDIIAEHMWGECTSVVTIFTCIEVDPGWEKIWYQNRGT